MDEYEFEFELVEEVIEKEEEPEMLFNLFGTGLSRIELETEEAIAPKIREVEYQVTEEEEDMKQQRFQSIAVTLRDIEAEAKAYQPRLGQLITNKIEKSYPKRKSKFCRRRIRDGLVPKRMYYTNNPNKPVIMSSDTNNKKTFSQKVRKRKRKSNAK